MEKEKYMMIMKILNSKEDLRMENNLVMEKNIMKEK